MAEVLDAREKKLVELSRSNMDLTETNNILRRYQHKITSPAFVYIS